MRSRRSSNHVSNASIKQPNDGLTYGGIRLRIALHVAAPAQPRGPCNDKARRSGLCVWQ
jgi:hypothetical protein